MLDPLTIIGLTASVGQVADFCFHLLEGLCDYCQQVKEASAKSMAMQQELSHVSHVLKSLDSLLKNQGIIANTSMNELLPQRMLNRFVELLRIIEARIVLKGTFGSGRLKFPFTQREINRYIAEMERYKSTFTLALINAQA
jgi:hypothetical protein